MRDNSQQSTGWSIYSTTIFNRSTIWIYTTSSVTLMRPGECCDSQHKFNIICYDAHLYVSQISFHFFISYKFIRSIYIFLHISVLLVDLAVFFLSIMYSLFSYFFACFIIICWLSIFFQLIDLISLSSIANC